MPKHTPGPWVMSRLGPDEIHIMGMNAGTVCEIRDANGDPLDEHAEPDARLIAAAPDLLEALSDLVAMIKGCSGTSQRWPQSMWNDEDLEVLAEARAAIEKATGE